MSRFEMLPGRDTLMQTALAGGYTQHRTTT